MLLKCNAFLLAAVLFLPMMDSAAKAEDKSELNKTPDEFFIAKIPDLPLTGKFRGSWYFLRPPYVWVQGKLVNLKEIQWPQWDENQVPASLIPANKDKSTLIILGENNAVIDKFELKKAFQPEKYTPPQDLKPVSYQIQTEIAEGRVVMKSPIYPWKQNKSVFKCRIPVDRDKPIQKNAAVRDCVKTLANLPLNSKQQWQVNIQWPRLKDPESNLWIGEQNRMQKFLYKNYKHIFESRREGFVFQADASVTEKEKIKTIEFPIDQLTKSEKIEASPTREEIQKTELSLAFENGPEFSIHSLAIDENEIRDIRSPSGIEPQIHLQFVNAEDKKWGFQTTEFLEYRTGFLSFARPMMLGFYGTYNSISSSRGEKDSFFNLPGIDFSWNPKVFQINPYLFFESGLIHEGSTLSISEWQVGAHKTFEAWPYLKPGLAYNQYSLSGKNPGSSRLGKATSVVVSVLSEEVRGDVFLRGRVQGMFSSSQGYAGEGEAGKLFKMKDSDLKVYVSGIFGFNRYAAIATNRLAVAETFTEDRWKIGVKIGIIGPDYFEGR
jgi:hypothetical protein